MNRRVALTKHALVIALVGATGVTGCRADSPSPVPLTAAGSTARALELPSPSTSSTLPAAPVVASSKRFRPTAQHGEVALPGGVVLPDHLRTPGAVNPAVTQSTIYATICRTGYTKTIRPPSSYTTALKRRQLASGYNYHGDVQTSDYEEDHLISLELGGSPSSERNLWPEPYAAAQGARVKDRIENRLHDLVCSGAMSLRTAQKDIAANWWTAYQRYGGASVPSMSLGAYGAGTSAGTSSGSTSTSGATAQCRDGSYSNSQHRSGTCSHHGGVARWINPPPA